MRLRQFWPYFGLVLLLFAGACAAPPPAPTGVVLLPSATFSPSPRPTYPPAVRDTATALALAAQLGGTPTPVVADTLSPEAPAGEPATTAAPATAAISTTSIASTIRWDKS